VRGAVYGALVPAHDPWDGPDRVRAVDQPSPARPAAPPAIGNRVLRSLLAAGIVRRLPLTDEQWTHIAKGEVRKDKVVGYHWTGAGDAVAEKVGQATAPDDRGVYQSRIQSRARKKDKTPVATKADPSTFWPDTWDEPKIRKAIQKAGTARNNVSEVLDKDDPDIHGMRIFSNPESRFPVYEPPAENRETKGGRRKK